MKRKVKAKVKVAVNPLVLKQAAEIKALHVTLNRLMLEASDNAVSLGVFIGLLQSVCDYRISSSMEALDAMRMIVLAHEERLQEERADAPEPSAGSEQPMVEVVPADGNP